MHSASSRIILVLSVGVMGAGSAAVHSAEAWEAGVRAGISVSGGKPGNDIIHSGIVLKYALSEGRKVGLSIDRLEYDFERPWAVAGVQQDTALAPEVIDAKATSTLVRAFYERSYGARSDRWNWHWNVGLGFAKPKVPTVSGPAVGGGQFTIRTSAGSEVVPSAGAGVRYNFSPTFGVELGGTLSHHRAKWKVTDTVSGRTGTVKSYSAAGVQAGVSFQF